MIVLYCTYMLRTHIPEQRICGKGNEGGVDVAEGLSLVVKRVFFIFAVGYLMEGTEEESEKIYLAS